ncbi:AAA family ATPase [Tundrisphaera sp. TA3]|uniref:AAA family ATPase n=1 Tax=Tundrisphaera sp. TA3 TaxID=3435775 RepID=UPI003EB6E673
MLAHLRLNNFTLFSEADVPFARHLNVLVGENGSGKSHLLKLAYSLAWVMARGGRESGSPTPTKAYLEKAIASKLRGVFRPDRLGRLARRQAGVSRCEVEAKFRQVAHDLAFSFTTKNASEVSLDRTPARWSGQPPVFLPTRELLTIYPGFVSLYETADLPFEETWRDTCILLGAPAVKGARAREIGQLLSPLEEQLGGRVVLTDGRFYLETRNGIIEAHLVAEGLRKLAMIARLIATGSLVGTGSLFWDEPEASLNPKVIKQVVPTILHLCRSGIQVFVATHSLFLMRELDLQLRMDENRDLESRYFGLHPQDIGTTIQSGKTVDEIGPIDALQEELNQSDRYLGAEAEA